MRARLFCKCGLSILLLLSVGQANAQQDLSILNASITVAGDAVYMLGLPRRTERSPGGLVVGRWKRGQFTSTTLRKSNGHDLYAGLAIGSSPSGGVYVAYARHSDPPQSPWVTEMMEISFESGSGRVLWSSMDLTPRSFAVSPQGYFYIAGLSRADDKEVLASTSGVMATLVHILDPGGKEVASFGPVSGATRSVMGLLLHAVFAVRSNGNFIVTFDPAAACANGYRNLMARNVKEYAPDGSIAATHEVTGLHNAVIGSVAFDPQERLIVQVVTTRPIRTLTGDIADCPMWPAGYLAVASVQSPSAGKLFEFRSPELLLGMLHDRTVVTRLLNRDHENGYLRIRTSY